MATTVGVRELKNRLSEFLRRVAAGEHITVTDRGRPIAVLGPPESTPDDDAIRRHPLVEAVGRGRVTSKKRHRLWGLGMRGVRPPLNRPEAGRIQQASA